MKKKIIITSIMTIVVCLSLITGATFAYFTNSYEVGIAVNSAKVNVTATIDKSTLKMQSVGEDRTDEKFFANGGSVSLTADGLVLNRVSPGDGVTVTIHIDNDSNISIKYNVKMVIEIDKTGMTQEQIDASEALKAALVASANINNKDYAIGGTESETGFVLVPAYQDISDISVSVELPVEATNASQGGTVNIKFVVEAVQGNGEY